MFLASEFSSVLRVLIFRCSTDVLPHALTSDACRRIDCQCLGCSVVPMSISKDKITVDMIQTLTTYKYTLLLIRVYLIVLLISLLYSCMAHTLLVRHQFWSIETPGKSFPLKLLVIESAVFSSERGALSTSDYERNSLEFACFLRL